MNQYIALFSLILSAALLTVSNAQARWGGGYYQCKKTPLVEYPGTIAEAAAEDPFGNLGILYDAVLEADPLVAEILSDPNVNLTVLGQDVFVSRGYSNPTVNQSEIQCQGVRTVNGTVWLIDSVLLPQYLQ